MSQNTTIDTFWDARSIIAPEGILIGCSQNVEWMLPWWWMNYALHNAYPITYLDYGDMTPKAVEWCSQRGKVIKLETPDFLSKREDVDASLVHMWESKRKNIWKLRSFWFNRILFYLKTPYRKTLWLDLDCQVRGSLAPIFDIYLEDQDFAIAPESEVEIQNNRKEGFLAADEIMYNCGVTAFKHGSAIIQEWVQKIVNENDIYMSDQPMLAKILNDKKNNFATLPLIFNWALALGYNPEALIIHYWGGYQSQILTVINHLKHRYFIDLSL